MRKKLNEDEIISELSESAFFRGNKRKEETRTDERVNRTVKPNGKKEESIESELSNGQLDQKELTERFSFEMYPSMKTDLNKLLGRYQSLTGQKLSISRFGREAFRDKMNKLSRLLDQKIK